MRSGRIRLEVHDGSSRRTITSDATVVRIGRDASCDVVLPSDPTVSRVHATLTAQEDGWHVTDNGSRNGTFVNGRRIDASRLAPADRILIGNFVVVVRDDEDADAETVAAADAVAARIHAETGLSVREIEVLRLVCAGDSDQQVAEALFISVKTVHSHLDRIRTKTQCRRRPELVRYAIEHGIA